MISSPTSTSTTQQHQIEWVWRSCFEPCQRKTSRKTVSVWVTTWQRTKDLTMFLMHSSILRIETSCRKVLGPSSRRFPVESREERCTNLVHLLGRSEERTKTTSTTAPLLTRLYFSIVFRSRRISTTMDTFFCLMSSI